MVYFYIDPFLNSLADNFYTQGYILIQVTF